MGPQIFQKCGFFYAMFLGLYQLYAKESSVFYPRSIDNRFHCTVEQNFQEWSATSFLCNARSFHSVKRTGMFKSGLNFIFCHWC